MVDGAQVKSIVPIVPRPIGKPPRFGTMQDIPQNVVANYIGELQHVLVVTYLHYLRDQPMWSGYRLIRRFPPYVFRKWFQGLDVNTR
jgi:hypothetical protein